jgi:hypothetical protein
MIPTYQQIIQTHPKLALQQKIQTTNTKQLMKDRLRAQEVKRLEQEALMKEKEEEERVVREKQLKKKELIDLRELIKGYELKMSAMIVENKQMSEHIDGLRNYNSQIQIQNEQLVKTNEELKVIHGQMQEQVDQIKGENMVIKRQITELQCDKLTLEYEKQELISELSDKETTLQLQKDELITVKKSIINDKESLYDRIDNMKCVIVASTGRSGSTTMQRIVATIPDSNISGENNGAIIDLLRFYRNVKIVFNHPNSGFESLNEYILKKGKPCWYNCFDFKKVKREIQCMILTFLSNDIKNTTIGFKEIRFHGCIDLLDEFKELFPKTKVVCHYRKDIDKQLKSCWWKETDRDSLISYNNEINNYYEKHKNYCYLTTFEQLYDKTVFIDLFNFFGEPFNQEAYEEILKNKLE